MDRERKRGKGEKRWRREERENERGEMEERGIEEGERRRGIRIQRGRGEARARRERGDRRARFTPLVYLLPSCSALPIRPCLAVPPDCFTHVSTNIHLLRHPLHPSPPSLMLLYYPSPLPHLPPPPRPGSLQAASIAPEPRVTSS